MCHLGKSASGIGDFSLEEYVLYLKGRVVGDRKGGEEERAEGRAGPFALQSRRRPEAGRRAAARPGMRGRRGVRGAGGGGPDPAPRT
ncbi:unnamed protein product [Rangifer tarandus platyrhynchus]|uniref:Uncharacterized protein n=1 Tax=Rangifer tarandus platyrhynchus TaxID=3082113 RepID=A0AC59ZBD6_RANTA